MSRDPENAAFAAVVRDHWDGVWRLLHTLSNSRDDADDLTQETFLRALKRFDSFRPGTNARAWLLRIATNTWFDLHKHRRRANVKPLPYEPAGREPHTGHRVEVVEEAARVRAALAELSDLTRTVFHLRVQEDLSFAEIAAVTGTSEQAARWHMFEARRRVLLRLADPE